MAKQDLDQSILVSQNSPPSPIYALVTELQAVHTSPAVAKVAEDSTVNRGEGVNSYIALASLDKT